jgi:hypothetical protein
MDGEWETKHVWLEVEVCRLLSVFLFDSNRLIGMGTAMFEWYSTNTCSSAGSVISAITSRFHVNEDCNRQKIGGVDQTITPR